MESNSAPNKIHVSESTALLIKAAGKEYVNILMSTYIKRYLAHHASHTFSRDWLTPREEKIVAKGKGLMQTYWCEPGTSFTISQSFGSNHDETFGSNHDNNDDTFEI